MRHNNVLIATKNIHFDEYKHAESKMLFALGMIFLVNMNSFVSLQ